MSLELVRSAAVLMVPVFVNAAVSVACSWLVAAIYFRKETVAERIGSQISSSLRMALIPVLYNEFFSVDSSGEVRPKQPPPKNLDVPHVEYAIFAQQHVCCGDSVEVLIKLLDTGSNLDNPRGVSVRDHEDRPLGVRGLGFGFCRCTLNIAADARPGPRVLTIYLQDEDKHECTQNVAFRVEKRSPSHEPAPGA